MRITRGPFPVIIAGIAIIAAVDLFQGSIVDMVRPLGDVLELTPDVITSNLTGPGALLVLLGTPLDAGRPWATC